MIDALVSAVVEMLFEGMGVHCSAPSGSNRIRWRCLSRERRSEPPGIALHKAFNLNRQPSRPLH
jgi:hypothetical protein